jgi:hypothetical protein
MATDYKGCRDVQVTPGRNSNGLDTIHSTKAKNSSATPRQILDIKFFHDSCWFRMTLDMGLVPLERLSPYLSKETKNTPIGCRMETGH